MGSIELTAASTWRARWRDPRGRSRRRTFKTKDNARLFLASIEVDSRRGVWVDPAAGRITVEAWVQEWCGTTVHLRASTKDRYERDLRRRVVPHFGQQRLVDVTPRQVTAWLAELTAQGVSPSGVNRCFRVLRMVMNAAVRGGLLASSPTRAVRPPPVVQKEMRFLSALEVRSLAEAIHPWFATWVYFAAYTGLRWSEMLGLRRRDIDLATGRVRVERQLTNNAGRLVFGPLKTAASRRTVTMPSFLLAMMREQLALRSEPGQDGLVFVNTKGHSPHASSFTCQVWRRAKREAGLDGVRWHDLRHTAVALAIERGAHAKVIQERMGHSTVKVTLDRYGHVLPSIEDKVAGGLDQTYHEALPVMVATADAEAG